MEKLFALLNLFRVGNSVADPAAWKTGGIGIMVLVPVLLALERVSVSFGYPLGIDSESASQIATGVVAIVGVITHVVSSDKIGLPAKDDAHPTGSGDSGSNPGTQGNFGILGNNNP